MVINIKIFTRVFIVIIISSLIGLAESIFHELNGSANSEKNKICTQPQEKVDHKAYHQGSLNAIETCEVGHAEAKIEGDLLKVWFVGGGADTGKSVKITDQAIIIKIVTQQKETKELTLDPKPDALAEETIGNCSYFEGKAKWIQGLKKFSATGNVNFKGKIRKLIIEYPNGYDPD